VKEFFPEFELDKKTKKPDNKSDRRTNPAALVEIDDQGKTEQRWVFAKYPEFRHEGSDVTPFHLVLDCPTQAVNPLPSYVIVTVAGKRQEVWSRSDGQAHAKVLGPEDRVPIPGTKLTFQIARFIASGKLTEAYVPTEERNSVAALHAPGTPGTDGRRRASGLRSTDAMHWRPKVGGSPWSSASHSPRRAPPKHPPTSDPRSNDSGSRGLAVRVAACFRT